MKKINTITVATAIMAHAVTNSFVSKDGDFAGKLVISGENGLMEVKSTDNIQTVIFRGIEFTSSDLTINSFSPISIDAKKMLSILKASKVETVSLDIHDDFIQVNSGRLNVKLETLAEVQIIKIDTDGEEFDISEHLGLIGQTLHTIDANNPKSELRGVSLKVVDNNFSSVATDGKRLSIATANVDMDDFEIIVQKESMKYIVANFSGIESVKSNMSEHSISFHSISMSYTTKLLNGKYVNWERVMPSQILQTVEINKEFLKTLLTEVSLFEEDALIEIKSDEIILSDSSEKGISTIQVREAFKSKEEITFMIKSKDILEMLSVVHEENITIGFNESILPIIFKANDNYRELVMPKIITSKTVVTREDADDIQQAA